MKDGLKKIITLSVLSMLLIVSALSVFGCEKDSSLENAAEKTGETIEEAGEEVGDAIKDAADEVEDEI